MVDNTNVEEINRIDYDVSEEDDEKCHLSRRLAGTVFKGMGKAGDAVLSGMGAAVRETGKHAKITRLKMRVSKLQHDIQKLHLALGKAVYEHIKQDKEDVLRQESVVSIVNQLKKREDTIQQIRDDISELKERVQEDAETGDEGLDMLSELAKDGSDEQRYDAISGVIQLGDEEAIPVLVAALSDNNPRIRLSALRGLYKLNTEESRGCLLNASGDEHPDVRASTVTYLGWVGDIALVDGMAQLLKDDDKQVRRSAAIALGNLSSESSVESLVDTLSGRVEPLINALRDEDVSVRQQAIISLRRITHQFLGFRASGSEEERGEAIVKWNSWWADHQRMIAEEQPVTAEIAVQEVETPSESEAEEAQAGEEESAVSEEPERTADELRAGGLRLIRDRRIEVCAKTGSAPTEKASIEAETEEAQEEEAAVEMEEAETKSQEEDMSDEIEAEQEHDEVDTIAVFIDERCEFDPEGRAERKVLYKAYEDYYEGRGLSVLNRIAFYSRIREHPDVDEKREGSEHYFTGMRLREE